MKERILFVDDDGRVLQAFKRRLYRDYDLQLADSAERALELIANGSNFSVIISDQQMPGMKGIEFLCKVKELAPMSARIMLTGNADRETAVQSVNESQVFRYLTKPCSADDVASAINDGLAHHRLLVAERDLLEQTLAGSAKLLVDILAVNDPHAFKQVSALRKLARKFALFTKHPRKWELDLTVMLSSIGLVMLPSELHAKLVKGEDLGRVEQQMVDGAPKIARDLLLNIPRMTPVAEAIYYKNKNFDGSGFPMDTVRGDKIPYNARVLRVLSFMAERMDGKKSKAQVFKELRALPNVLDPQIVAMAENCFRHEVADGEESRFNVEVSVQELSVGDVLIEDIYTIEGKLALRGKRELTEALIQKVRQFDDLQPLKQPIVISRIQGASADRKNAA